MFAADNLQIFGGYSEGTVRPLESPPHRARGLEAVVPQGYGVSRRRRRRGRRRRRWRRRPVRIILNVQVVIAVIYGWRVGYQHGRLMMQGTGAAVG
jgi:hypothetical protein